MNTLGKHKKKGLEGFKKFVGSLESMNDATRMKVVQVAILEDPVYLMAAMSNMTDFNYIFKYGSEDIQKIYSTVAGGVQTLLFALHEHPKEQEFLMSLDDHTISSYKDEKEYLKDPTPGQIVTSRKSFVTSMRALQENFTISNFDWKLPSDAVIHGKSFDNASSTGEFKHKYDDGTLALQGDLEKKLRVGEWKHFYPNGQLMADGVYISSEKAGPWKFYFATGELKASGEYKENLKEGTWEEYDREGTMTQVIYKRGKPAV